MKTIADYIKSITEDAPVTNTISGGAIATKEVPISKMAKRLKPMNEGELCVHCGTNHNALDVTPASKEFDDKVPLANTYAVGCYAPTADDIHIKRKSDLE